MNYEQKYKDALERAKTLYENANDMILKKWVEQVFPELQENEDERIRKELIEHIKANCASGFILFQKFSPDDVIAWLEKQGKIIDEYEDKLDRCACENFDKGYKAALEGYKATLERQDENI